MSSVGQVFMVGEARVHFWKDVQAGKCTIRSRIVC